MNIRYTGIHNELDPKLQAKLDTKFVKLSKLLERRGEQKGVHVVVTHQRHVQQAEITLRFDDHSLVGTGRDADLFAAICAAIEHIEKQARTTRTKRREKARRGSRPDVAAPAKTEKVRAAAPPPAAARKKLAAEAAAQAKRVFRVNHHDKRKPMTIDEAMLEMENGGDYLVYRDANKESVSVLVRRKDGHFDLIEG